MLLIPGEQWRDDWFEFFFLIHVNLRLSLLSVGKRGYTDIVPEIFCEVASIAEAELLRDLCDGSIGEAEQGFRFVDTGILRVVGKGYLFDLCEHFPDISFTVIVSFGKIGKFGHIGCRIDLRTDFTYDFLPHTKLGILRKISVRKFLKRGSQVNTGG